MMRPVLQLARLNHLDLAVDTVKARLAEVCEALREPAVLRAVRRTLAQGEAESARCAAVQEAQEHAQAEASAKLARADRHLYDGAIHNPKELENSRRDVEQLRRQRSVAEDALLESLIAVEAASQAVEAAKADLGRLTADWEARQGELRSEQARLEKRLAAEQARLATVRSAVPADLQALYDMLRPRRGGRAVAELDGDSCSACRVAASPAVLEAARYGEELAYCENCGRLLWGE
jgi:uncharacterized protein